ncbi:MAG: NAD(P)/FAD-dependent oxidoreductase [Acidobacteriota bacterium]
MDKHLVLVGGGHAHMTTLLHIGDFVKRGHRVTLVSPSPYQYYSGMGPGMLSGIYKPQDIRFHVRKMAETAGAAFIEDSVVRVNAGERVLRLKSGRDIPYDVASFNTGSEVFLEPLAAPRQDGVIPVKPIINLYKARETILRESNGKRLNMVVVGGGAAGVEISANLRRLMRENGRKGNITLLGGSRLLGGYPDPVRRLVEKSLERNAINLIEGTHAESVKEGMVNLADTRIIPYDLAFLATGVKVSSLFAESGLPVGDHGELLVDNHLRSIAHPELFGGGDCIALKSHRLAKVGVYAVRQNPILRHNLLAFLEGRPLKIFDPGGAYLLVMNMGDGTGSA